MIMKQYLLIALTYYLPAANRGKKNNAEITNDSLTTATRKRSAFHNRPAEPAGKIDIENFGDIKLGQPYLQNAKSTGRPGFKIRTHRMGC